MNIRKFFIHQLGGVTKKEASANAIMHYYGGMSYTATRVIEEMKDYCMI